MKIGAFDSGRGGMTIMEAVKAALPDEEYFYIADSEHCPYGEKTMKELYPIVRENVEELKEWGAEIIVIACNTATVKCIEKLREDYPELKFVGTEPAIKLAAESGARNILVLATPGTVRSERTLAMVEKNKKSGQEIKLLPCAGLADTIERGYDDEIDAKLSELLSKESDIYDVIVLGCTHYPLISEKIQRYFPSAKLVDSSNGVAKQVTKMVRMKRL